MDFTTLISQYISEDVYSFGQLAQLSGVPKKTIHNWANGIVRRPRNWQALVRVAAALRRDATSTDALLSACGMASLRELAARELDARSRALLAPWSATFDDEALLNGELLQQFLAHTREELSRLPAYFPRDLAVSFTLVFQDMRLDVLSNHTSTDITAVTPSADGQPWSQRRHDLARTIVVGHPGTGKTWLLKAEAIRQVQEVAIDGRAIPIKLPIYLPLAELAAALPEHPHVDQILDTIAMMAARSVANLPEQALTQAIRSYLKRFPGQTTVLLDALDEVPARDRRRSTVRRAILQLGKSTALRIWMTTRTLGYAVDPLAAHLGPDVTELMPQPLNETEIARVLRAWTHGRPARFQQLQHAMRRTPALIRQAANPLLLSMICMLADVQPEALNESRGRLLERVMRLLLEGRWRAYELQLPETRVWHKLRLLETIAWRFATHRGVWNHQVSGEVLEEAIASLPVTRQLAETWRPEWDTVYEGPLWELSERDGILIKGYFPRDGAASHVPFCFTHRTFQEILVARYLARCFRVQGFTAREVQQLLTQYLHDPEWYRVLLLLNEHLMSEPAPETAALAMHLSTLFLSDGPDPSGQMAVAAGEMIALRGVEGFDPQRLDAVRRRLVTAMRKPEVPTLTRVHAGRVLSGLGDPRSEVTHIDGIEFIDVPAGSFTMGSDPTRDPHAEPDEGPQRSVTLPAFRISRFLISNGQYRAFLDAPDGFDNPAHWPEAIASGYWHAGRVLRQVRVYLPDGTWRFENQWLREPTQSGWPATTANHPATGVNWYEARAFTRWLEARLRTAGRLSGDDRLDVPSEFEWEKTARGDDGRVYCWGDQFDGDRLNWRGLLLMSSTPLGAFPGGASPYGAEDMLGGLWEWTRSVYTPNGAKLGNDITAASSPRTEVVLRGGAYFDSPSTCRAAARGHAILCGVVGTSFRVVWRQAK